MIVVHVPVRNPIVGDCKLKTTKAESQKREELFEHHLEESQVS